MIKALKYIVSIILIAVAAYFAWSFYKFFQKPEEIEVSPAKPGIAEEMARLCSVEIYNEVPVLDTVNYKVMFAVQKQSGSISFDIDHLEIDDTGDTVRIILPREIVDVYESTDKNSWQVIDTKAIGPMAIFRSNKFSAEEENRVKSKLKARSVVRLYENGTVRQARKDASENLTRLMESVYKKPVVVTDPTPEGTHK